jgi:hypothetical protein
MRIYHRPRVFCWLDTETTGIGLDDVPVQVGFVLTDEHLNPLGEDEFLVRPATAIRENFIRDREWTARTADSFAVHNLSVVEVLEKGLSPSAAASRLIDHLKPHTTDKKPILVSDNPVFDERMLRTLFWQAGYRSQAQWPFHYSAWSPVMLQTALGLRAPTKPHNALADVKAMLDRTREALELLETLKGQNQTLPTPDAFGAPFPSLSESD